MYQNMANRGSSCWLSLEALQVLLSSIAGGISQPRRHLVDGQLFKLPCSSLDCFVAMTEVGTVAETRLGDEAIIRYFVDRRLERVLWDKSGAHLPRARVWIAKGLRRDSCVSLTVRNRNRLEDMHWPTEMAGPQRGFSCMFAMTRTPRLLTSSTTLIFSQLLSCSALLPFDY
jgi:hypothetical protein